MSKLSDGMKVELVLARGDELRGCTGGLSSRSMTGAGLTFGSTRKKLAAFCPLIRMS